MDIYLLAEQQGVSEVWLLKPYHLRYLVPYFIFRSHPDFEDLYASGLYTLYLNFDWDAIISVNSRSIRDGPPENCALPIHSKPTDSVPKTQQYSILQTSFLFEKYLQHESAWTSALSKCILISRSNICYI